MTTRRVTIPWRDAVPILRVLWRLRPRPWYVPWRSLAYYRWRLETFTGVWADEVTWRLCWRLIRTSAFRQAVWRYLRWAGAQP